jgi:hypothetical protein
MTRYLTVAVLLGSLTVLALGCGGDRPREYARQRPAVDELDHRDRGIQSRDVVDATDTLMMRLLALPEFNQPQRRTVVVLEVDNRTNNPRFNYDIFLQRLRGNVGELGRDRIAIIAQRGTLEQLQRRELDRPLDPFQQGGAAPGAEGRLQPEFALTGTIMELPGRGTSYYNFEFTLTHIRTGEQIPLQWETRVAR